MENYDLRGLVDLETRDAELEDLIIREYEGRFFDEQHRVVGQNGYKKYEFFRLSIIYLLKFFERFGEGHEYVVRKSSDQQVLIESVTVPLVNMN